MRYIRKLVFILLIICPVIAFASGSSMNGTVVVEKNDEIIVYIIGKRQVPSEALLDHFGRLIEEEGRKAQITIIFSDEVPIKNISNLRGIIQKAGLSNIKQYTFNPYTRKMVEIKFRGPAVPLPKY